MPKRREYPLAKAGNVAEGEYRELPDDRPQRIDRRPPQRIHRPGAKVEPPSMPNVNVSSMPSISRGTKPTMVFMLAITLYLMATWEGFGKPALNTLVGGSDFNPTIPFPFMVGGFIFVLLLSAMSEVEDGNVALWMVIGMWLLFIMFYGQTTWKNFWGWFTASKQTPNTSSGFSTILSAFQKTAPLPDTSGSSSSSSGSTINVSGNYQGGVVGGNSNTANATPSKGYVNL